MENHNNNKKAKHKTKKKEILVKLGLILFGTLFSIIILEVVLRITLKEDYSTPSHRNLAFEKKWEEKYSQLNSMGFRDHEFSQKKDAQVFRILVIGDSMTWGVGVKDIDQLYTEVLEKKLNSNSRDVKYEVLNTGKNGMGVDHYLNILKNQGISFEPDLVMIGFFFNDIESDSKNRPKPFVPEKLHFALSRISYLYWYGYNAVDMFFNRNKYLKYYLSYSSPESEDWKRFEKLWADIHQVCNTNTIRMCVVLLPMLGLKDMNPQLVSAYTRVGSLSRENGAKVLDLTDIISLYDTRHLRVGITDAHPNEKGHSIYAERIYDFLIKENLLSSSR